jgi:hypothetical protein
VGGTAAVVVAAALVAPVVLSGGGSSPRCAATLLYAGRSYTARPVAGAVQAIAVGVGVVRGCGAGPSNVDVRSLVGVQPAVAVGLSGDQSSVYVRRGTCPSTPARSLLACLRR